MKKIDKLVIFDQLAKDHWLKQLIQVGLHEFYPRGWIQHALSPRLQC